MPFHKISSFIQFVFGRAVRKLDLNFGAHLDNSIVLLPPECLTWLPAPAHISDGCVGLMPFVSKGNSLSFFLFPFCRSENALMAMSWLRNDSEERTGLFSCCWIKNQTLFLYEFKKVHTFIILVICNDKFSKSIH